MRVLNLYSGLGGNRKQWKNVEVTAIEYTEEIANIYSSMYPDDKVIVADAKEYLRLNFQNFDFIWSSPPCQSHTRMIRSGKNRKPRYPDLTLYEEILFLKYNCKKLWIVENVIPYYSPLISPSNQIGRHLFWSNFYFMVSPLESPSNFINGTNLKAANNLKEWLGINYEGNIYYEGNHDPAQILRNCVHPWVGNQILKAASNIMEIENDQ